MGKHFRGHRLGVALTACGALAVVWSGGLRAQGAEPRIWQGIYSDAQAARGKEHFLSTCVRCHGQDLAGTTAPALTGDRFQSTFGHEPVDRLFLKIRDTMPPSFGSTLDDQAKLDIVAFVLQSNDYPAGPAELKLASEDLATAQVLRKGESAAVQNFSLVQTVGCLARGAGNTWMLTRTTDPVATRDEGPTPQALVAAATRALGTKAFRLLNAAPFAPEAHIGQKMEARGLVYEDNGVGKLTVTSLRVAADTCEG